MKSSKPSQAKKVKTVEKPKVKSKSPPKSKSKRKRDEVEVADDDDDVRTVDTAVSGASTVI